MNRMQNLINQVAKDKTDNKNKETLKRMQEKASRLNAVSHEKKLKEERGQLERMERQELLNSQMENDAQYA